MLVEQFGLQSLVGASIIVCLIAHPVLAGRLALERVMAVFLMAMYALFIAYFGSVAVGFGLAYVLPLLLIGLPRVLQHRGSSRLFNGYHQ